MEHTVYLGLGSNQGDRLRNMHDAIEALQGIGTVDAVSAFYETEPWGYVSRHKYINAAVRMATRLEPVELLDATQDIERRLGRRQKTQADGVYHDRPMDIDILLYDDIRLETPRLVIPHPRIAERDFVKEPLKEVYDGDKGVFCI